MITKNQIEKTKEAVRGTWKASGDSEIAHAAEDLLYHSVLEIIRLRSTDPRAREIAAEALKSKEIEFPRWCS